MGGDSKKALRTYTGPKGRANNCGGKTNKEKTICT